LSKFLRLLATKTNLIHRCIDNIAKINVKATARKSNELGELRPLGDLGEELAQLIHPNML
jgi:hypothetical protein